VFAAELGPSFISQLWLVNSDGSDPHVLLSEDSFFDWLARFSPDGSLVVFTRCTLPAFQCAIARIGVDGSNLTALTPYDSNPDVSDFQPAYSPDGTTIAFESTTRGGVQLAVYLMDTDGKNIRQLTPAAIEGIAPDWSPDGSTIAFSINFFQPLPG